MTRPGRMLKLLVSARIYFSIQLLKFLETVPKKHLIILILQLFERHDTLNRTLAIKRALAIHSWKNSNRIRRIVGELTVEKWEGDNNTIFIFPCQQSVGTCLLRPPPEDLRPWWKRLIESTVCCRRGRFLASFSESAIAWASARSSSSWLVDGLVAEVDLSSAEDSDNDAWIAKAKASSSL
jgi:hypothetical protein